ncbi:hypothetical protein CDAR_253221 [Caerostris darwini]|uniref:Uncharacterized protein n=1 Tax=Caerostris darwini TaxID=1538125 RepID=A0AAV4VTK4_9ARAC|nr:hypothetical protein CDAR_253221 [Caerostris darwini]
MINYTLLPNTYSPNKPSCQCPTCPRVIQRLGCRLVGLWRGLGSHRRQWNEEVDNGFNKLSVWVSNEWRMETVCYFACVKSFCMVIIRPRS